MDTPTQLKHKSKTQEQKVLFSHDQFFQLKRKIEDMQIAYELQLREQKQVIKNQKAIIEEQKLIIEQLKSEFHKNDSNNKIIQKVQHQIHESYRFSQKYKRYTIQLSDGNSKATHSALGEYNGEFQLVLIQGKVLKSGSSIRLRIQNNKQCINIGLVIKSIIMNSYELKYYESKGHGCFLMMWNGKLLSHSYQDDNLKYKGAGFGSGDVELIFTNQTKNTEYKMRIKLSQKQWDQAYFCIATGGQGDSVKIL